MTGLSKFGLSKDNPALALTTEFQAFPRPQDSIPISIISNSLLLREGLLLLLPPCLNVNFVDSYAGNLLEIKSHYLNPPRHIVLIDSNLGMATTLEWIHYWKNLAVPAQVIVLESLNDPKVILNFIEAGANGYTLQGATAAEVAQTIQAIRHGQAHCAPEITAYLFARLAAKPAVPPQPSVPVPLTLREQEVLRYIAADFSNQQIAEALFIEVLTVKHHVHNILSKLKVGHRQEAARLAREQNWLE